MSLLNFLVFPPAQITQDKQTHCLIVLVCSGLCLRTDVAMAKLTLFSFLALCLLKTAYQAYQVPPAKLEAIYPKGLRVSVKGMIFYFCFL